MKRSQFLLCYIILFISACKLSGTDKGQVIILQTDKKLPFAQQPVFMNLDRLQPAATTQQFPLLLSGNETIPSQLIDNNGDGVADQLFFIADLSTSTAAEYHFKWMDATINGKQQANIRFGARQDSNDIVRSVTIDTFLPKQLPWIAGFQKYQTDGPTWENDKVGFRIYLDGRNSIDVFGKTKPAITPANVGISADGKPEYNYAAMLDWGTDILAVGNSTGIGGVALKHGSELVRLGVTDKDSMNNVDTTIATLLNNGPLYAAMQFNYKHWHVNDGQINYQQTISTWPGMYGFRNTIAFATLEKEDTVLLGLVNSNTAKPLQVIQQENVPYVILYTHDKQSVDKKWWLGLALMIPTAAYEGYIKAPDTGKVSTSYLAKLKLQSGEPLSYYSFACWELSDAGFANEDYFKDYLVKTAQQLSADVRVSIK